MPKRFLLVLRLLLSLASLSAAEPSRPPIVVFLADGMGWGDSSTYGHKLIQMPNLDKLAGAKVPADRVIDGKDIWPTVVGKEPTPHEAFFYHRVNTLQAVRSGKWKLHTNNGKPVELYDLGSDIGEKNNVIKSHPDVVKRLKGHLQLFAADIAHNSRPAAFVDNPRPLSL